MAFDLENFPTSETAKRMMSRVSPIYDQSYVAKWLYQVMGLEWDQVREVMDSMWEQPFLEQATWGLRYWEQAYGLDTDETKSYEERRRLVAAKRSAQFPMNPARFETGGSASLIENVAPYTSILTVRNPIFSRSVDDMLRLLETIRRVKPSHHHIGLRVTVNPTEAPLHIGVTGAIISRLAPAEQPDNLTGTQTLRAGGRFAAIASAAPAQQPDKPPVPRIVRHGGRPAIVHVLRGREIQY